MVKLEIEVSEEFYDNIQKGKEELKEKYDWKLDDGEYIEKAMEDFIIIIAGLRKEIQIIKSEIEMIKSEKKSSDLGIMYG